MFGWLVNAWRVPELRRRLLFTAAVLAVYRFGSWVPAPGINESALSQLFGGTAGNGGLGLLHLFSGSALPRLSLLPPGLLPHLPGPVLLPVTPVVRPPLP